MNNPGPVGQGFGTPITTLITQGYDIGSPAPVPSVTATTFEIVEAPFGMLPR